MKSITAGERVLVTGGTGSLGVAIGQELLAAGAKVRSFSRDEKKQLDARRRFPDIEYMLGDIRDPSAVRDAVRCIDTVIHGASLKQVDISEKQPYEYVTTNVGGTVNLINAVLANGDVRRCVGISSDKAVNPVNTYGLTKALLEKLVLEANRRSEGVTAFTVARYGNVVGTRGSVLPFWRSRVAAGLSVQVTNPAMTRFFFTMDEAIDLIDRALDQPAGRIVSKRMDSCTIADLAEAFTDGPVEVIGERPGEKLHEMLLSATEMTHTVLKDKVFVYRPDGPITGQCGPYTSENAPRLGVKEITALMGESLIELA